MATYELLTTRILRKLDDPSGTTYNEDLVYDAVVSAHTAILPWVPKTAVGLLTSGSAGQTEFALPADLYQIQAVQEVRSGKMVPRATLAPHSVRMPENYVSYDWIDYPHGYLSLSLETTLDSQWRLFYLAYWTVPDSASDLSHVLEVPTMSLSGMAAYAASYCLKAKASNTANIRQWAQRMIDSGSPEDNPLLRQANALYADFLQEMKLMPPYFKVTQ